MKIIISPAKKMNTDTDSFDISGLPEFLGDTEILKNEIRRLSLSEAKALWKCNDKLALLNYERFQTMDLTRNLTPAIMAYEGLQYQHMAPAVLTREALSYIGDHLCILSGFYGLLKPFDGVTPYRLEMQAKLALRGCKDLYDFWGDRLYKKLRDLHEKTGDSDRVVINLASKEYSRCIERYITCGDRLITVEFGETADKKVKQKGTLAKMARGEMVRFLAENQIGRPEDMREFHQLGFAFSEELSEDERYVFIRKG
ncbi:MAG: peroxide stress protein YaaA [Hungatella sp.]|nr:peroxide stress protein YaaA [Hungatella sp.]